MNGQKYALDKLLCPKCGTRFPVEQYAPYIEMGVDGFRFQCAVCLSRSMIEFSQEPSGERKATVTLLPDS
jgi:hypothetical protein